MAKLESGTRIYGNVTIDTFVTAVGNVTGGNLLTAGLISATANVTANNGMFTNIVNVASHTGAVVSVTGNVTANNGMFTTIVNVASHTGAVVSVTGNVTGGNILTAGLVSATANITGGNLLTAGLVSATGNSVFSNVRLTKFNETTVASTNTSTSIAPDVSTGTIFAYTANNNFTFNTLTNAVAGSSATVIITQDGVGSRLLTSTMKFANASKTLSTAASSIDIIAVFYDGTTYYASLTKGYA